MPELSRRGLLGGVAALGATGLLAACGRSGTDAAPGADTGVDTGVEPADGPWRWTDGLGQDLELEQRPTRIAAFGDQAAALIGFGITPVAIFHYTDPAQDSTFESIDLSGIEVVGTAYGEIDVERLAATRPELVLTTSYDGEAVELPFGFKDESQVATIRELAPVGGVLQAGTAADVIRSNSDLVATLGVDVEGGEVAAARAAWEAASAELAEAARSGVTVAPVYAEQASGLWFAKAPDDPALSYYAEQGVRFVDVTGGDYYWHQVSWENADRYPSDVVLYSVRDSLSPEELLAQPTFARRDAARADQLHPWKFRSMDYTAQASYMRELAGWLAEDRRVV